MFSKSQMALLYDLPLQDDLDNWRKIKLLVFPSGLWEFEFDTYASKETYLQQDFVKANIGVAPEQTYSFSKNIQAHKNTYWSIR